MSRMVNQPVGQKRLTNVAVVRLKKDGRRFEIACYKNKVLSWRSRVEKDLDEVLQSHTVYVNVSRAELAKSQDLIKSFGTDDQTKICLEILEKGELQIAGKERESQLSIQFRDVATIVMQKTLNPETQRPYTISMIERFMHEIHFAVDPNTNSKKQALDVIRELQKYFPIKRSPMRLRLSVPKDNFVALLDKLNFWNSDITLKDDSGNQPSVVCDIEPNLFRDCDAFIKSLDGRLEILAVSVHAEGDVNVDQYDDPKNAPSSSSKDSDAIAHLTDRMQEHKVSAEQERGSDCKQNKCSTCDAVIGDAKQYREHFKTDWHKHNLKRKTRQLPPLSQQECLVDVELRDSKEDLKEYSF